MNFPNKPNLVIKEIYDITERIAHVKICGGNSILVKGKYLAFTKVNTMLGTVPSNISKVRKALGLMGYSTELVESEGMTKLLVYWKNENA